MKVLIVGAGGQGGSCASILARQDSVDEIRLVDLKEETAKAVADHIGGGKIRTGTVNALDPDDVARAAEGVDVVVDMVMPWMVPYVMEGALKAKANYINTAFDAPFWDKFVEGVSIEDMPLCKEFKEAGLTALFGCGFAPGWTNVLARRLANRLDNVDSIKMRIGKATHLPGEHEYDWVLRPWNPGWSPKQALIDCASPTYALEGGKYVQYPPFGGLEMWDFPEPVGRLPVTHHSHEEIYSMPATFKGVKDIDFKYYLMYQLSLIHICAEAAGPFHSGSRQCPRLRPSVHRRQCDTHRDNLIGGHNPAQCHRRNGCLQHIIGIPSSGPSGQYRRGPPQCTHGYGHLFHSFQGKTRQEDCAAACGGLVYLRRRIADEDDVVHDR